jgi:peptidoglycan/LPS O-acetylase OafA/YrhL
MNTNRYAAVDGLRALAALMVMHCHIVTWNYHYPYPAWTYLWTIGDISVIYFIAISGFCLALPVIKYDIAMPSVLVYLARRAARILPPYWAAIGIGFFVFLVTRGGLPNNTGDILRNFSLMIHDVTRTSEPINGPLWTIGVEWRCYLLLPIIVIAWRRFGYRKTFVVTSVLTLLFWFFLERTGVVYAHSPFLIVFMLGIGAAYIATGDSPSLHYWQKQRWWIIAAVANLSLLAYHLFKSSWPQEWHSQYSGLFYILLIGFAAFTTLVVVGSGETWSSRLFSWRPLAGIGQWSYSLYLLHIPVFYLGWLIVKEMHVAWHPYLRSLIIFVPLTLAMSYAFYCMIERPSVALSTWLQKLRLPSLTAPHLAAARTNNQSAGIVRFRGTPAGDG